MDSVLAASTRPRTAERFCLRRAALVGLVAIVSLVVSLAAPGCGGSAEPVAVPEPRDPSALAPRLQALLATSIEAVRARPGDHEAWGRLGIVYDVHDLKDLAIASYAEAEARAPGEFRWPYFRGHCLLFTDVEAAVDSWNRALEIDPNYAPLHAVLGRSYRELDEEALARRHFERALELEPTMLLPRFGLARLAIQDGQARRAVAILDAIAAEGHDSGELNFLLADAHRVLGEDVIAEQYRVRAGDDLRPAPLPDPVRSDAHWGVGVTERWRRTRANQFAAEGRIGEAIAEWQVVLEDDPTSLVALRAIADIHVDSGRPDRAVPILRRLLAEHPDEHESRSLLGVALVDDDRVAEGIEQIKRAVAAEPTVNLHQLRLARAYRASARYGEAMDAYDLAIERAPRDSALRREYARMLSAERQTDQAIDEAGADEALARHQQVRQVEQHRAGDDDG